MGWALNSLALLAASEGDLGGARATLLDAAAVFERDDDVLGQLVALQALGAVAALRGDDVTATRNQAAAESAARRIGAELPRIPPIVGPLEAAAARLAPDDLQRERGIGVALGAKSMLATALASRRADDGTPPGP